MLEVEKRVLIKKSDLPALILSLHQEGKQIIEFKRFTMVKIDNSDFIPKKDSPIDIKIRTSKTESLFTVKVGNWHADTARKENEIHFDKNEIGELISMLVSLGYKYFVAMYVNRMKFELNDMTITIDNYHHLEDCLVEVEILIEALGNKDYAEIKIQEYLEKYNLKPLGSQDTINFITKINMVKQTQIDFEKVSIQEWESKWEKFIRCEV